jgi:hypothetical protein
VLFSGCKPRPATAPAGSNRGRHGIARNFEAFGFTNRILGPRSVCARLYVVRPRQVFGGETALPRRLFAETARFIKVSALIQ